jgi:hypothetical protein
VVPAGVEEIVRRGLGKTADDRFDSAEDYMAAIDQVLEAEAAAHAPTEPPAVGQPAPAQTPVPAAQTPAQTPVPVVRTPAQTPVPPARTPVQTPVLPAPTSAQTPVAPARAPVHTPPPHAGTELLTPVPGTLRTGRPRLRSLLDRFNAISRAGRIAIAITSILVLLLIVSAIVGRDYESSASRDELFAKYTRQLKKGKTCPIRREAVVKLRALGDKRAIPALKKAKKRKDSGLGGLGIKRRSINRCLRDEADAAIKFLEKL